MPIMIAEAVAWLNGKDVRPRLDFVYRSGTVKMVAYCIVGRQLLPYHTVTVLVFGTRVVCPHNRVVEELLPEESVVNGPKEFDAAHWAHWAQWAVSAGFDSHLAMLHEFLYARHRERMPGNVTRGQEWQPECLGTC